MKVCKKCKSTLINNKWIPTKNLRKRVIYTVCPTCAKGSKETSNSVVLLDAQFFKQHEKQSMQLIYDVEREARSYNTYSRILLINSRHIPIMVRTTHPLLAIQIGKQFQRIFHGKLSISKNGNNGVVVRWIINPIATKATAKIVAQPTPA